MTALYDQQNDGGESILLSFAAPLPQGYTAGAPTTVLLTDFVGSIQFDRDTYTAPEGGAAARIVVRLGEPAPAATDFALSVTHLGGATAADYVLSSQTVSFNAGQQTQTVHRDGSRRPGERRLREHPAELRRSSSGIHPRSAHDGVR